MKWVTRRNIHVDRTSCPWLIRTSIDPQAEFVFVEPTADPTTLDGHTFDMRGAEYSHEGDKCTCQVMVDRHELDSDAALVELGRIIRAADVPPSRSRRPESAGLDAFIRGLQLSVPDDHEKLILVRPLSIPACGDGRAYAVDPPRAISSGTAGLFDNQALAWRARTPGRYDGRLATGDLL